MHNVLDFVRKVLLLYKSHEIWNRHYQFNY